MLYIREVFLNLQRDDLEFCIIVERICAYLLCPEEPQHDPVTVLPQQAAGNRFHCSLFAFNSKGHFSHPPFQHLINQHPLKILNMVLKKLMSV